MEQLVINKLIESEYNRLINKMFYITDERLPPIETTQLRRKFEQCSYGFITYKDFIARLRNDERFKITMQGMTMKDKLKGIMIRGFC